MRWLITGAVRRATAVMPSVLRGFDAQQIKHRDAAARFANDGPKARYFLETPGSSLIYARNRCGEMAMKPAPQALSLPLTLEYST